MLVELIKSIAGTLTPCASELKDYLVKLDKNYSIIEGSLLLTIVCYRSNATAGALILILVGSIVSIERHYPSPMEIIELN